MRGIHKLEDFDLVLGVLNDKAGFEPASVKKVERVVSKLDSLYLLIDRLEVERRNLLNEAAIVEENLVEACRTAKRQEVQQ